jgi:hypothetical protein
MRPSYPVDRQCGYRATDGDEVDVVLDGLSWEGQVINARHQKARVLVQVISAVKL